mmetsp:Transcript_26054/g.80168  ORF Transcript_26054/g.80168 Transcript_26054/m.80168 type:complete len:230 (-) Transcript_26054:507-1196(-)
MAGPMPFDFLLPLEAPRRRRDRELRRALVAGAIALPHVERRARADERMVVVEAVRVRAERARVALARGLAEPAEPLVGDGARGVAAVVVRREEVGEVRRVEVAVVESRVIVELLGRGRARPVDRVDGRVQPHPRDVAIPRVARGEADARVVLVAPLVGPPVVAAEGRDHLVKWTGGQVARALGRDCQRGAPRPASKSTTARPGPETISVEWVASTPRPRRGRGDDATGL